MSQPKLRRILVIEDNRLDRDLLLLELAKGSFSVTVAETGKEAVRLLKKQRFDAAMVDLKLPDYPNAVPLIKLIKLEWPRLIIFVVTGNSDHTLWRAAMDAGAFIAFPKPYNEISNRMILQLLQYREESSIWFATGRHWFRGLVASFVGGAAGALDSGLALIVVAPDKFNLHDGLARTLITMGILGLLTGLKLGFMYLHKNPLPPAPEDKNEQPERRD